MPSWVLVLLLVQAAVVVVTLIHQQEWEIAKSSATMKQTYCDGRNA